MIFIDDRFQPRLALNGVNVLFQRRPFRSKSTQGGHFGNVFLKDEGQIRCDQSVLPQPAKFPQSQEETAGRGTARVRIAFKINLELTEGVIH
jgi:hypothetical protein